MRETLGPGVCPPATRIVMTHTTAVSGGVGCRLKAGHLKQKNAGLGDTISSGESPLILLTEVPWSTHVLHWGTHMVMMGLQLIVVGKPGTGRRCG